MSAFFKQILGDSYKDNLTHEELESLVKPKFENLQKERDAFKVASDKNSSEASEFKKKYQEKLTDAEKKELEFLELQKEVNGYKREKSIAEQKANLIALGYEDTLAQETAIALIDNDFATVMKNQKLVNEQMLEKAKQENLNKTPTPPAGENKGKVTKEEFNKMGYQERLDLFNKDPITFNELSKK